MPTGAPKKRYEGFERRVLHIGLALLAAFIILTSRLWYLQVVHGHQYSDMAENNRLFPQRLKAPRGMIYGRGDTVLADNRPACDLVLVPAECDDPAAVCRRLEELIHVDANALMKSIENRRREPFEQIEVKRDVTKTDLIRVEEHSYALRGVFTVVSPQRRYLYGTTGGQILGYLGEISEQELPSRLDAYKMGDRIGRSGIEQMYEDMLHGTDGHTLVTRYAKGVPQLRSDVHGKPYIAAKDSYGHQLEEDHRLEPTMGAPLHLTLDIELQAKVEQLLVPEVGSIVVLNAETGEILALASTPTYDPNVFVMRGRNEERQKLLGAATPNPMVSRAFREVYPPGSVFKVLLACAALEEKVIDEGTSFSCPGAYQIDGKGRKWHCWRRSGHGSVNVVDALAFSCDVFFWNAGRKLGIKRIGEYAHNFGMGEKTGIDLPGEEPGLIPSEDWWKEIQKKRYPDKPWEWVWRTGDTINAAIGQGSVTATPLQNAVLMAAIVNGGYRVRPYLNQDLGPERTGPLVSEKTIEIVRKGMLKCVDKDPPAPTGTGNAAKIDGMTIIGKTGSAQVASLSHYDHYKNEADIPYEQREHAWFVAGVMNREPKIALCVLVEHGLHGSEAAAPLAKQVIEAVYKDQPPPQVVALAEDKH